MTPITYINLIEFCYKTEFSFQKSPETLDPSHKTEQDFWDQFEWVKPRSYNLRNKAVIHLKEKALKAETFTSISKVSHR